MDIKELRRFQRMQSLKLNWQLFSDDEFPFGEECVTLKVSLKDGCSKILAIDTTELTLYSSFFKGTALFTWGICEPYSTLKQKLEELLDGDVEAIFREITNIVIWWRINNCEEGSHYPYAP